MVVAKTKKKWVEEIERSFTPKVRMEEVPLSLIIPTYNCSACLDLTLSTLKRQNYTPLEVIIIDASSTDNTHAILAQYTPLITRVYSVAEYDLPEMINRGVALATGEYVSALYPSCFLINDRTFDIFAEAVIDHGRPDLVTCETLIHFDLPIISQTRGKEEIKKILKRGLSPTAFAACWFKKSCFLQLGRIDSRYQYRFALDFFCRLAKLDGVSIVQLDRTLVDHSRSLHLVEYGWQQFVETAKILRRQYGLRISLKYIFNLRFSITIRLLWRSLKTLIFENPT